MNCASCAKELFEGGCWRPHIKVTGSYASAMMGGRNRTDTFCLSCWRSGNVTIMEAPEEKR